jgi:membrane-bound serine protease (ClpP class)
VPGVTVNYRLIVPVAIAAAVLVVFLGRLGLAAQRNTPVTGAEGLVGEIGRTLTAIGPDLPGQVTVHGEIWRAVSQQPLAPSTRVRVGAIEGLTLAVEAAVPPAPEKEAT